MYSCVILRLGPRHLCLYVSVCVCVSICMFAAGWLAGWLSGWVVGEWATDRPAARIDSAGRPAGRPLRFAFVFLALLIAMVFFCCLLLLLRNVCYDASRRIIHQIWIPRSPGLGQKKLRAPRQEKTPKKIKREFV